MRAGRPPVHAINESEVCRLAGQVSNGKSFSFIATFRFIAVPRSPANAMHRKTGAQAPPNGE